MRPWPVWRHGWLPLLVVRLLLAPSGQRPGWLLSNSQAQDGDRCPFWSSVQILHSFKVSWRCLSWNSVWSLLGWYSAYHYTRIKTVHSHSLKDKLKTSLSEIWKSFLASLHLWVLVSSLHQEIRIILTCKYPFTTKQLPPCADPSELPQDLKGRTALFSQCSH